MTYATATAVETPNESPQARRTRIRQAYESNPSQMTLILARQLGVPEAEVIRALPEGLASELDAGRWEEVIRALEAFGDVHVIASNGSVTLECFGAFGNFSTWQDFFNVQTKTLDIHIRFKTLGAIFALEKPGHIDSVKVLSFQFFNRTGDSAFKVFLTFGGKEAPEERKTLYAELKNRFALTPVAQ